MVSLFWKAKLKSDVPDPSRYENTLSLNIWKVTGQAVSSGGKSLLTSILYLFSNLLRNISSVRLRLSAGVIPGYTDHLPIEVQFSSPSMLVVSWVENDSAFSTSSTTALYHTHLDSYSTLSMDTTTSNYYSFTALDSCSPYVVCVEIAGTLSFTCLSTITGELIRKCNFTSVWWHRFFVHFWDIALMVLSPTYRFTTGFQKVFDFGCKMPEIRFKRGLILQQNMWTLLSFSSHEFLLVIAVFK